MKELTEEQKNLADQMVETIKKEIQEELNPVSKETNVVGETIKPNALVDGILEWSNTLDFNNLNENSVLLVKVNVEDPEYAHQFQMGVVRHILEPRFEMLKEKKITVMFISHKDDISTLSESDMAKSGWIKQEPKRIITL